MSQQLSKLHVRFIQTQGHFHTSQTKKTKLPLSQLYIKDNQSFYLALLDEKLEAQAPLELLFEEPTAALKSLSLTLNPQEINPSSPEYEDGLLFFNIDETKIKQLFLLTLTKIQEA